MGVGVETERSPGPIVLFDGLCNFCDTSVNFIIDRDPRGRFRFAPLQSESAKTLLLRHGLDAQQLQSVALIEGGICYTRSTAALRIARRLSGPWPLLYAMIVVPRPLRDLVYDWIARNRYRWFGTRDACRVPTSELRSRFMDESRQ